MAHETPGRCRRAESSEWPRWRAPRRRRPSGRLQIGLERVDRDLDRGIGVAAPELAAIKHDRVEPLRVLAFFRRRRIRKHMTAVIALDHADMATYIARQAGMGEGVNIPGAHLVARLELRGRLRIATELAAH